jgi:hypothetical protein
MSEVQARTIVAVALTAAAFAAPARADDAANVKLAAALHGRIAQCWSVPSEVPAHVAAVRVKFALTPSGALDGSPEIEGPVGGDPATKAFVASALRAVVRCAPFPGLAELAPYDTWKTVVINFKRPEF